MPSKEKYNRLVRQENKCPRCNGYRDNRDRVECSKCRKRSSVKNTKANKEMRVNAIALFGIKPKSKDDE